MSAGGERLRLAVVFGGAPAEHVVSVHSARAVLAAADRQRFELLPFGVTPEGAWLRPEETETLLAAMEGGAPECVSGTAGRGALAQPQALGALAAADVVFPLIHGRGGEDGTLQGLLELAAVPYVGAGVAASAVGMDKELLKRLFAERGLPVVPLRVVTREAWERDRAEVRRAANELSYPLFVKPANGGSSVGITKVPAAQELDAAIEAALQHDHKALVEQGAVGRELECGVLGNARPEASPVGEIRYRREFYDYAAKYEDEGTELIVPADLPAAVARQVQSLACAAFQAIDCAGMARVDFFLDRQGQLWLNELNTIPGFTSTSMFPRQWEAGGLPFPALIERLVDLALERHRERGARGV